MNGELTVGTVLDASVTWREVERGGNEFEADVHGHLCKLRMNDYPEEPLYTLIVGSESVDLDDAPPSWGIPAMPDKNP